MKEKILPIVFQQGNIFVFDGKFSDFKMLLTLEISDCNTNGLERKGKNLLIFLLVWWPVASKSALGMQTMTVRFKNCLEHCNCWRVMTCANYLHSLTFHLCCLLLIIHTLRVIVWPLTLQAWSALKMTKVFWWWIQKYPYRIWIQKYRWNRCHGVKAPVEQIS